MAKYHNNDCARAALIYFKDGVSAKQARDALASIEDVLKPTFVRGEMAGARDCVQEYDPNFGGPVWYIP